MTIDEIKVVSLKCMLLERAGEPEEIAKTCPKIEELDISETSVYNWTEVINIVSQLPVYLM